MHSLTSPDILHEHYRPNEPIHTFRHKETHIYNKIKEIRHKKKKKKNKKKKKKNTKKKKKKKRFVSILNLTRTLLS